MIDRIRPRGFALVAGFLLTACAGWQPEGQPEASQTPFAGPAGAYDRALHDGYLTLARADQAKGQLADSDYFAGRAAAVAGGRNVDPQRIDGSKLPPEKSRPLASAWGELIALQDQAIQRAYNPDRGSLLSVAARAQVLFDCWRHKEAEGRGSDDVRACREAFRESLQKLREGVEAGTGAVEKPSTFLVYFDHRSSELDALGQAVIAEAEAAARKLGDTRVSLVSSSGGIGDEAVDRALADLRASAVAKALATGGLSVASIDLAALPKKVSSGEVGVAGGSVAIVVAPAAGGRITAEPAVAQ